MILLVSSIQLNATRLYAADNYTVTASVSGGHGSVNPATQSIVQGNSAIINIAPDTGYYIASITDNGNPVSIDTPCVIPDVNADHTVIVTFAIEVFGILASEGSHGSITPGGVITVNYGTNETFTITPDNGYSIYDVQVDSNSVVNQLVNNTYTFGNVTDYHGIFASFVQTSSSVSINPADLAVDNGASFTVNLAVDALTAVRGWQGNIDFDPAKVHCTGVTEGTFLSSFAQAHGGSTTSPAAPAIDNTNGHITNICYVIMGAGDAGGAIGTGTLCTLSFTANQDVNDTCTIAPNNTMLIDTNSNYTS